ncbi:65-kDa microtubule-associated protein 2-like [Salvia miltiorrhiza]|uniref:65-kDa microtubule-associated protein 2-like n=1 Tax=Salvia miltiorrhiza TaxID=226208 RepID=UPI0025ACBDEE|nr:65-kDa microtubule-associated protein 2-like [Salvia miltiorrhiza]
MSLARPHRPLMVISEVMDERLQQLLHLLNIVNAMCLVLGMDFKSTICSVHPSLDNACERKSISADTIQGLSAMICTLKNVKLQRMQTDGKLNSLEDKQVNYFFSTEYYKSLLYDFALQVTSPN